MPLGLAGKAKLDASARKVISERIDNFAVQYRRKLTGVFGGMGSNWFYDEDIKFFVDRFVAWVEAGLAAENP